MVFTIYVHVWDQNVYKKLTLQTCVKSGLYIAIVGCLRKHGLDKTAAIYRPSWCDICYLLKIARQIERHMLFGLKIVDTCLN